MANNAKLSGIWMTSRYPTWTVL